MPKTKLPNQRIIEGKNIIDDILNFSKEEYQKKEKPSLLPAYCKTISPIECFQALVNKHDEKERRIRGTVNKTGWDKKKWIKNPKK